MTMLHEAMQSPLPSVEVHGIQGEACKAAVDEALTLLAHKLPTHVAELTAGTEITIAGGVIESGGSTDAEHKKILLGATKNALSLQAAEDFLVEAGYLNKGDWTKALPNSKEKAWSCLTYQLVHEYGHLIDGLSAGEAYKRLDPVFSPTKYGSSSSTEAFPEAFAYRMFDLACAPEAEQAVSVLLTGDQPATA